MKLGDHVHTVKKTHLGRWRVRFVHPTGDKSPMTPAGRGSSVGLAMRVVSCRTPGSHSDIFSPSPFLWYGVNPTSCLCSSTPICHTKCSSCLPCRRQSVVAGARCACAAVMHTASVPPLRRCTRYSRCSQPPLP
ncbi:unnamed protein product [Sphacelaria rigidula]